MSSRGRLVRGQLTVFAVLAVIALVVVSFSYLQVPRMLGWGQMSVSARLPSAGGLSANAPVTFRGQPVGQVKSVRLSGDGVLVDLEVDRDADLPADVQGQVHSTSVIGEQYLELLPTGKTTTGPGTLAAGAVIPPTAVEPVPVDAGTLLTSVDALVRSIDSAHLRTTVDELNLAFSGSEEPLTRLIDGSNALVGDAQANLAQTKQLIANLEPVLQTQVDLGGQTKQLAANTAAVTETLSVSDADLRRLIDQTPAAADQLIALVKDNHAALPQVLANLAATGEVFRVYLPGVKQVLSIYPALIASLQSLSANADVKGRTNLFFRMNINDPAPCREGFKGQSRSATILTDSPLKDAGYCQPSDPNTNVRGSRNSPCPNDAGRSATAAGCGLDFTKAPVTTLTSYDKATGRFRGPDGQMYTIEHGSPLLKAISGH